MVGQADTSGHELEAGSASDKNSKSIKDTKDEILREYHLIGAWPTNVSAINLAYDSNDQIEEFDVEFQYQYMDVGAGNFSVGSGDLTTQF